MIAPWRGRGQGERHDPPSEHSLGEVSPELLAVLESAARLQQMVPDAVLVGGGFGTVRVVTGTPSIMIMF